VSEPRDVAEIGRRFAFFADPWGNLFEDIWVFPSPRGLKAPLDSYISRQLRDEEDIAFAIGQNHSWESAHPKSWSKEVSL